MASEEGVRQARHQLAPGPSRCSASPGPGDPRGALTRVIKGDIRALRPEAVDTSTVHSLGATMTAQSLLSEDVALAQAEVSWRFAAREVRESWSEFVAARGHARATTFAAYVAALDREEEAASELSAIAVGA